jgi:hypothetical protein
MAESIVTFPNIGSSQSSFSFSFDYIAATDIDAFVEGVSVFANNASTGTAVGGNTYTVAFSSGGSKTLTFSPAVPQGSTVRIERNTALTTKAVDFSDGAVLTEVALDSAIDQLFFATQESNDKTNESVKVTSDGKFDALSKVIKNVATPVADTDAVNKAFISTNLPNINTVAGISTEVTTVAGIASDVTAVVADQADIGTVATSITNVDLVATNITSVNTNATNITAIQGASANATTATDKAAEAVSSAEEAEAWAQKIDGEAQTGEGYSSKAWAIGDTGGVSNTVGSGNAKDWATETSTTVDTNEYSAKEYAIGAQRRGQANGGSAKDWATYVNGEDTVDGTSKSARYWAQKAQDSKTEFSNIYHGESSTAPTGSEVGAGDLWFDSGNNVLKYYNNAGQWVAIAAVDTSSFASTSFSLAMAIAL